MKPVFLPVPIVRAEKPEGMRMSPEYLKHLPKDDQNLYIKQLPKGGYIARCWADCCEGVLSAAECAGFMREALSEGHSCRFDDGVSCGAEITSEEELEQWIGLTHLAPAVALPKETIADFRKFSVEAMRQELHPVLGLGCHWYLSFRPKWSKAVCRDSAIVEDTDFLAMPLDDVIALLVDGIKQGRQFTMLDHGEKFPMAVGTTGAQMMWHLAQAEARSEMVFDYIKRVRFSPNGLSRPDPPEEYSESLKRTYDHAWSMRLTKMNGDFAQFCNQTKPL